MMVVTDSQEQKWYEMATENLKVQWIYCKNVEECLNHINKHETI